MLTDKKIGQRPQVLFLLVQNRIIENIQPAETGNRVDGKKHTVDSEFELFVLFSVYSLLRSGFLI